MAGNISMRFFASRSKGIVGEASKRTRKGENVPWWLWCPGDAAKDS